MDNFDFKKFLVENKLGAYSKAVIKEEMEEGTMEETTPKYKTYADVVNAIAKRYSYTVYHDEIEEFMHDEKSLQDILAGKDPIEAYEDFYNIKRESIEEYENDGEYNDEGEPIEPHPFKNWPMNRDQQRSAMAKHKQQQALKAVEYPKSGLQIKGLTQLWSYANKAGVDLHSLAKQTKSADEFAKAVAGKIKGFDAPKIATLLKQYHSSINK